jgi:hypothetical protein
VLFFPFKIGNKQYHYGIYFDADALPQKLSKAHTLSLAISSYKNDSGDLPK